MEKEVNPVNSSTQIVEKKEFNFCSNELVLDYSVMNFPCEELSSQPQTIINYFW